MKAEDPLSIPQDDARRELVSTDACPESGRSGIEKMSRFRNTQESARATRPDHGASVSLALTVTPRCRLILPVNAGRAEVYFDLTFRPRYPGHSNCFGRGSDSSIVPFALGRCCTTLMVYDAQ